MLPYFQRLIFKNICYINKTRRNPMYCIIVWADGAYRELICGPYESKEQVDDAFRTKGWTKNGSEISKTDKGHLMMAQVISFAQLP
jgi:hypothetical protein